MTVLVREEIEGKYLDISEIFDLKKVIIQPLLDITNGPDSQLGSAGIDLRLDTRFRKINPKAVSHIDLSKEYREYEVIELDIDNEKDSYVLHPEDFVLGQSLEYIRLPDNIVGRLDGRSSMGRLGLVVHSTAGCVDPGFQGHLVFELCNIGKIPVVLRPFIRIARLTLYEARTTKFLYSGKYQFQTCVKPTKPDIGIYSRGE